MMYFASIRIMKRRRVRGVHARGSCFLLVYSTGLLLLITIWVVVQATLGQQLWITNSGDTGYLVERVPTWYQIMGTVANVMLNLMSDGLLVSLHSSTSLTSVAQLTD